MRDNVAAIDPLDQACRNHDFAYATPGADLQEADEKFFKQTFKGAPWWDYKSQLAGAAVGIQGLARGAGLLPQKNPGSSKPMDVDMPTPAKTPTKRRMSTSSRSSGSNKVGKRRRSGKNGVSSRRRVSKRNRRNKRQPRRRRVKKNGNAKFYTRGCVMTKEFGGQHTDPQCIYVGHGIASNTMLHCVFNALVRGLLNKHGIEFSSYQEPLRTNNDSLHVILYYMENSEDGEQNTATVHITDTMTCESLTTALLAQFDTVHANVRPAIFRALTLHTTRIQIDEDPTYTPSYPVATIMLDQVNLDIDVYSTLKIQNTTLANATDYEHVYTAVDNNPIVGFEYKSKKWTNILHPHGRHGWSNQASYDPYRASDDTGLVLAEAANSENAQTRKPPPGWYFGAESKKVIVPAGGFRVSKWRFKTQISMNTWAAKMALPLTAHSTEFDLELGKVEMFGLEKVLDSRQGDQTPVRVQFQLDQTYKVAYTMRKTRTLAIQGVATSASTD